jgi:hypothetical protein
MRSAPDITNVVEACNLDGRQERLENMLSQLEMCEKALQDYLETKRIAFPRYVQHLQQQPVGNCIRLAAKHTCKGIQSCSCCRSPTTDFLLVDNSHLRLLSPSSPACLLPLCDCLTHPV